MKRSIRLKELAPGTEVVHTPPPEYLERTDGSLPAAPYLCRVDDNGFLVTGNEVSPTSANVAFMGDSFVESMYSDERERFVFIVERELAILGKPRTCLNAAYSGATTLHLVNSIINKVYPAIGVGGSVVVFPPHSDRDHLYVTGSYWNASKRGATILPPMPPRADTLAGAEGARAIPTIMVAAATELGMNIILATTPFRIAPFSSDRVLRRIYKRDAVAYAIGLERRLDFCNTIREVARTTGARLIDAEAHMAGDESYFYDELHLNQEGQARFGRYLADQLAESLT